MAKKLNSMPDFTAHLPKSVHDLSQSTTYTCTPGMLSPIYHDMLHTGDKIHFSASQFVRLNPLVTQPLGQIDVHLDYFFVPLSVLYTPSPSLFYQTDDLISSNFKNPLVPFNDTTTFPVFDFTTWFINCFMNDATGEQWNLKNASSVFQDGGTIATTQFLPPVYFDCLGRSVYRLFDFLDMNPESILDVMTGNSDVANSYPHFTPWFALAYQAIYQFYFRNDDREVKNYHYNIDNSFSLSAFSEDPRTHKSIFQINYCQRPKDYFNSVKVSPITSSMSSLSPVALANVFSTVNQWISEGSVFPAIDDGGEAFSNISQATQTVSTSSVITSASVRNLFMVEKLLRVIGRTEKNYESQFLAHFGVKIPHDSMHNITHIGHDMVTLTPDSVISQANTWNSATSSGSALGEIGGKGSVMLSGRKHSFEAPFHGVFMCISHIIPRRRYVLGLSKLHQLSKITDFWQPEFDKKGMQPLFVYEALFNSMHFDTSERVGWQFAYEQFKRKADRVTTAFVPTRSRTLVNTLAPWTIANRPYHGLYSDGTTGFTFQVSELASFYMVQPTELNVCMQVPYEPAWSDDIQGTHSQSHKPWLLYQRDPFICDFNMYCKKVNGMSEYGEPEL